MSREKNEKVCESRQKRLLAPKEKRAQMVFIVNLGAHSLRKGAVTYCSSGSTMAPSIIAICLRAGWSLKGVEDRYFRLENAMDQFLGRVVAGLDLMSGDFAILPPFFAHSNEADRAFILQSKSSVDVDTLFVSCFAKKRRHVFHFKTAFKLQT